MLDSEFDDMQGTDVREDLELEHFQRDTLEPWDPENQSDRDSVWLECNGELFDVGSVKLVAVRKSARGFETLLFICPRCRQRHESIRFRDVS
jgi:hypothetical protein